METEIATRLDPRPGPGGGEDTPVRLEKTDVPFHFKYHFVGLEIAAAEMVAGDVHGGTVIAGAVGERRKRRQKQDGRNQKSQQGESPVRHRPPGSLPISLAPGEASGAGK